MCHLPAFKYLCKALRSIPARASVAAMLLSPPALAQVFDPLEGANPQLVAEQADLLAASLAAPENVELAFRYAEVSVTLGDYEAAISTLERLLIFSPGLGAAQLELGALYFRLGSFEVARTYLEFAQSSNSATAETRERAAVYLAAIEEAEDPASISGTVILGVRYQSNANAGPSSRFVTLNGIPYVLDETAVGDPDVNGFIAGGVHGAYDVGNQGDLLEADLVFYGSRYADFTRLDTELAELTFGPSFSLGRFEIDNARLGVYGILGGVRLNGANYSGSVGSGLKFEMLPDIQSSLNARAEIRRRWFNDTATYPTVTDYDGYQLLGVVTYSRQATEAIRWWVQVLADYEEASANFEQSWEAGFALGATYTFSSPIDAVPYDWAFDLEAGYIRRDYDEPNPAVSLTQTQYDNEGWLRAILTVPVREDVALALTGELHRQQSNYVTREYSDASATISVIKNF
ncbi:hypothetical protein H2509_13830 [Stappia sp. F7233]|uniref:Tetratricopeptide repeat protein n=1 Tax=Stappia albiluteola TaxID=2758565 RepID=A0A839AGZ8_9HYPH|nr:hypothetical protein [Stappia albiluteola]MBA5778204.1 hypothetical protein [Stappia albiluteola]